MINELMKVADAIKSLPGTSGEIPNNLQALPKASVSAPCIRAWLTTDGEIDSLEKIEPEHASHLRKFALNKFSSLPGFNVSFLHGIPDDKRERELEKTLEGLRRNFNVAREVIEKRCGNKLDEDETLGRFLTTVKKIDVGQFQKTFDDKVQNNDWGWKVSPGKRLSVFLDIKEYADFPVAHSETLQRLNLLLSADDPESTDTDLKDAYNNAATGLDALFSDITLPRLLGQIKMRSLNKDIPAQERYGVVGSATFPVGRTSRRRTQAALEWISALENEGSLFGVAGDKELLFAYPVSMPQIKTPLARMLGAHNDAELAKERFGKFAKSVIDQLKGQGTNAKNAELEIFALRKMDKARTKVVYYRNVAVPALEAASKKWDEGCLNIPEIDLRDWPQADEKKRNKKNEKAAPPIFIEQLTVFPIKLHRFLNTVWTHDLRQSKVSLFAPGDGLSLLLDTMPEVSARFMLERFLQHAKGYFKDVCVCHGKREISRALDKAIYPGILGLLLHKLGQRKDKYMKEAAFQLGRSLRIADEIHRLYCEKVRDKQYPSELCGSALLVAMQESPTTTLAQLCQRAAPYLKWARAYQKEDAGLVHSWLNKWEPVADALHGLTLPQRLDVAARAEVFLGYLASFPKKEQAPNLSASQADATEQGE